MREIELVTYFVTAWSPIGGDPSNAQLNTLGWSTGVIFITENGLITHYQHLLSISAINDKNRY
ncbi:hypothetical protein BpHYR1_019405 [Brachionus plicatilis]|uniref:Uncharacterized protein n=1 Tax=Brachionus plicatilis TaxID=10195 RepID=A0A3M7SP36_BRAPC|nr:hypothetical protein BpHYR1_019405 [Brachionus plicatilis]